MPSMIQYADSQGDVSVTKSFVFVFPAEEDHIMNKEKLDDYIDDDDPGFEIYVVNEENFVASCKELAD